MFNTSREVAPEVKLPTFCTLINKTALPTSPSFQALRNTAFLSFILIPNMVEEKKTVRYLDSKQQHR
jgi:hypothetical protein